VGLRRSRGLGLAEAGVGVADLRTANSKGSVGLWRRMTGKHAQFM